MDEFDAEAQELGRQIAESLRPYIDGPPKLTITAEEVLAGVRRALLSFDSDTDPWQHVAVRPVGTVAVGEPFTMQLAALTPYGHYMLRVMAAAAEPKADS